MTIIKAISLHQPWASMIASRRKTIETRMWATHHRGRLLICSSKKPEGHGPTGVALALVVLSDCRLMTADDEAAACCECEPGRYAWVLANIRRIVKPFPVKGRQGLFKVELPNKEIEMEPDEQPVEQENAQAAEDAAEQPVVPIAPLEWNDTDDGYEARSALHDNGDPFLYRIAMTGDGNNWCIDATDEELLGCAPGEDREFPSLHVAKTQCGRIETRALAAFAPEADEADEDWQEERAIGWIDRDTPIGRRFRVLPPHAGDGPQEYELFNADRDSQGNVRIRVRNLRDGNTRELTLERWNRDIAPHVFETSDAKREEAGSAGQATAISEDDRDALFIARQKVKDAQAEEDEAHAAYKSRKARREMLQKELEELLDEVLAGGPGPLFDGGAPSETHRTPEPDEQSESGAEPGPDIEAWRTLRADEQLLDVPAWVFGKLAEHEPPIKTLGELSVWMAEKGQFWAKDINGVGNSAREKVEAALAQFWSNHPEYCQPKPEEPEPEAEEDQPEEAAEESEPDDAEQEEPAEQAAE